MAKIKDFSCTYDNGISFGTWMDEIGGISFPQVYTEHEMMKRLALVIKDRNQSAFCQLPFCHTLEAEILGGCIRLGDKNSGPRVQEYRYHSLEEILKLPEVDIQAEQSARLRETLQACKELSAEKEDVLFLVSGPLTILNSLLDTEILFYSILKQPELVRKVCWKLGHDILKIMKMAEEAGVRYISYADPSGGVNIVGPKVAARIVKDFTEDFLEYVDRELRPDTMVLLCPKTALALIGTECAKWREHELPEPMGYTDAAVYLQPGTRIRFAGQTCINHTGEMLKNRKFYELILGKGICQ